MRLLVTGGSGFIGQHLCRELAAREHYVVTADRAPLHPAGSAQHFRVDLRNPGSFAQCVTRSSPDSVIHLAAQVGRLFGEHDIRHTVRSNVELTAVVAVECARRGIRVAYASTSEVYGDRGDRVCFETDQLNVLPHNAYGLTKRQGEELLALYTNDPTMFRLSMPYGPGVPPGRGRRALDTMLWQAHHRMPLTVHRGAERSWCWVGDTVRGMVDVLEHAGGGAWNVGRDDTPVSMLGLAIRCCDLTGAPTSLIHEVDPPAQQTVVKRLSTERLRTLGWAPRTELADGLLVMRDWVTRFGRDGQLRETAHR